MTPAAIAPAATRMAATVPAVARAESQLTPIIDESPEAIATTPKAIPNTAGVNVRSAKAPLARVPTIPSVSLTNSLRDSRHFTDATTPTAIAAAAPMMPATFMAVAIAVDRSTPVAFRIFPVTIVSTAARATTATAIPPIIAAALISDLASPAAALALPSISSPTPGAITPTPGVSTAPVDAAPAVASAGAGVAVGAFAFGAAGAAALAAFPDFSSTTAVALSASFAQTHFTISLRMLRMSAKIFPCF